MLPCNGCAYRDEVPGSAHSRCVFKWRGGELEAMFASVPAHAARWYRFPLNYDPVWGPNECAQRSETRDPEKVAPSNPWTDLLSLLS